MSDPQTILYTATRFKVFQTGLPFAFVDRLFHQMFNSDTLYHLYAERIHHNSVQQNMLVSVKLVKVENLD